MGSSARPAQQDRAPEVGTPYFRAPVASVTARQVLVIGILAAVAGRVAMGMITSYFTDDAYFYAVLARNLAAGRGWTFDGVTSTNGAHPLLLGLETLVAWGMGPGATTVHYYRALVVMFGLLFAGLVAAVAWLARPFAPGGEHPFGSAMWLTIGALFVPAWLPTIAMGMESSLAFPLAALFFLLWSRQRDAAAGVVGGLLALTRLDTPLFFLLPFALVRLAAGDPEGRSRGRAPWRAFLLVAPTAVAMGGYLLFNQLVFGSPVPIHGVLKSSLPALHPQFSQLAGPPGPLWSRLGSLHMQAHYVAIAALLLMLRRRRFGDATGQALLALMAAYFATQVNFVLFQKWSKAIPNWYLWQPLFTATLAFAIAVAEAVPPRALRLATGGLGIVLVLAGTLGIAHYGAHGIRHRGEAPTFWHTPTIDYVRTQPRSELWAATDCGRLSFWSERRFVDVDGLVSGFELQARIARGGFGGYLRELGVTRVLVYAWDRRPAGNREYEPMYRANANPAAFGGQYDVFPYYVYSYQHLVYSDTLQLRREQETWRSPPRPDGPVRARDIAYDLGAGR
jgi:hypothetical protein